MRADVKMLGYLVIDRPEVVSRIYGSFIIAPEGGWHVQPELFKE
jgi:hypothetical protein